MTIYDEVAYERGKEAAIKHNANIGRRRRWLEADPSRQRIIDFLFALGEFAATYNVCAIYEDGTRIKKDGLTGSQCSAFWDEHRGCDDGYKRYIANPVVNSAYGDFYNEMGRTLCDINGWGHLTEGQEAAVRKMMERAEATVQRWDEERNNAQPCPEGRIEITGKIISMKEKETAYGFVTKMLVKSDSGFMVFGTCPSSIPKTYCKHQGWDSVGKKIVFTATVTRSKDDDKFGFFKRPAKASIKGE